MRNLKAGKAAGAWAPIAVFVVALLAISCGGGGGGGSTSATGGSTGQTTSSTGGNTTGGSTTGGTTSTTGSTTGGAPDGPLGCSLDSYSPNYCQETDPGSGQPNKVHWWNHIPLKVYFNTDPTIQGQLLSTVCMNGFNAWSVVAGENVATIVGSAGQADVVITFDNLPSAPGGGQILGQAQWSYNPTTMQVNSATILLKTWNGMTLAEVADGLRRTAQHEFGHVIFMGGHSETSADTMYPSGPIATYTPLTTRDENSLNTAYCGSFADRSPGRGSQGPWVTETISCP